MAGSTENPLNHGIKVLPVVHESLQQCNQKKNHTSKEGFKVL